jgi:hypothetical protein
MLGVLWHNDLSLNLKVSLCTSFGKVSLCTSFGKVHFVPLLVKFLFLPFFSLEAGARFVDRYRTSQNLYVHALDFFCFQLQLSHDDYDNTLNVHVIQGANLRPGDINGLSDPFVKVYLLLGRG